MTPLTAAADIVGLRGWEIACVATWALGAWLVVRLGGSRFYAGLYAGSSVLVFWDWLNGSPWFFRLTFDDRFVDLFTIGGVVEPAWVLVFLARRAAELVERAGFPTVGPGPAGAAPIPPAPADGPGPMVLVQEKATVTVTAADARSWLPAFVTVPIAPAAMYIGTFGTAPLLEQLDPFVPLP